MCNLKTCQGRTDWFPAGGGLSSPVVNLKLRVSLLFEEVSEGGGGHLCAGTSAVKSRSRVMSQAFDLRGWVLSNSTGLQI